MADFDDTNRWVLFVNDKGDNEKRPDYRGTINVNGEEFELSGWKRTSGKGVKFLSGSVSEKQERASGPAGHADNRQLYGKAGKADHGRAAAHDDFENQDIPF
jgi:hypothetical protein